MLQVIPTRNGKSPVPGQRASVHRTVEPVTCSLDTLHTSSADSGRRYTLLSSSSFVAGLPRWMLVPRCEVVASLSAA
ncbi:hypothetical protein PI125_g12305 [Phytophthora idaei]|nr:hypothetical protein PI125_g12305 [Phytophthora idaei]